jgi:serine/threonine-protein kinase
MGIGDLIEGRYRILRVLGEGGMGTVFLAEHTLIQRKVAVKVLHAQFASDAAVVERFMNEARAAGTLGHPNIVESTDMGFTHDQVPYIVFEYLEGSLLTDEIYRVGGLPMRRAVRIAEQIANALRAAHDAGIVHRDLKSDNIFLTDKDDALDHVKVLDFGISRFLEKDDGQRGIVMGTPEFMAPEQITHPDAVDRRADIYALGVILYEMLTARRPFTAGKDTQELQRKILGAAPPPLERDVPHGLSELIIDKLLAKEPAHRPQTMSAVLAALEAFLTRSDGTPIPRRRGTGAEVIPPEDVARASGTIPRAHGMTDTPYPAPMQTVALPAPPRRKLAALYGAAGVGVALGAIGLVIGLRRGPEPPAAPPPAIATPQPSPAPAKAEPPHKVEVRIDADVKGARVVFRRRLAVAPMAAELSPSDIVEMVEVSATGYKTERYWLTFDRHTQLKAHLARGTGIEEATEEQTLVALGELAAPAPESAQVASAASAVAPPPKREPASPAAATPIAGAGVAAATQTVMARRRIGRSAADSAPETTVKTEEVRRPQEQLTAGAVATESVPAPAPVEVAAPPIAVTPPESQPAQPEPPLAKQPASPAPVAPKVPATLVPPATLKGLIASSTSIEPPDNVQHQMMRDEVKKASAVIKVCIGNDGAVTTASVARSSGYPAYDQELVAGVRTWRYRPYMVNGQATPACSAVAFAFAIQ